MGKPKKENTARIVVFGESSVGKTCFTDMFLHGKHFIQYNPVSPDLQTRSLPINNEDWTLSFTDLSSTVLRDTELTLRSAFFDTTIASADGVILLYDITSLQSFENLTDEAYFYLWDCRSPSSGGGDSSRGHALKNPDRRRFGCVVVGNKADVVRAEPEKREVSSEMAEQWASSQGFRHVEVSSNERGEVEGAVEMLIESIKIAWRRDAEEVEERKRMGERRERGAKGLPKKPRIGALGDKLKLALRTTKPES